MSRIRLCPHCGKGYAWEHPRCDHCDRPPRTLDDVRNEVASVIREDIANDNVGRYRWNALRLLFEGEACRLCAERDGKTLSRGELEALVLSTFCEDYCCRCVAWVESAH